MVLGLVVAHLANYLNGVPASDSVDPGVRNGGGGLAAESLSFDDDLYHDWSGVEHDGALLSIEEVPSVVDVALGVPELEETTSDAFFDCVIEHVLCHLLEFVSDGRVHAGEVCRDLVAVVAFFEPVKVVDGLL